MPPKMMIENKYDKALWYEIFEKKEYQVLEERIKSAKHILDLGWYKGYFSFYCKEINPRCKISFVEAYEEFIKEAQILLQKFSDIIYLPYCITNHTKEVDFFIHKEKWMQSSTNNNSFLNSSNQKIRLKSLSFEQLLKMIDKVDLAKIDIEGEEIEILLSFNRQHRQKIDSVFCEYHLLWNHNNDTLVRIKQQLQRHYESVLFLASPYTDKIWYIYTY